MSSVIFTRNHATHRPATKDARLPAAPVETFCLCGARVMLRRGRYMEHSTPMGRCEFCGKTPSQARQMAREEAAWSYE